MTPEIISAGADSLTAVSTTIGILIAAFGLSTWRKQLRGASEYDLAKRLLICVYKVKDTMDNVRSPFLAVSEAGEERKDNAPWEVRAYNNRWKKVVIAMDKLDEVRLEAAVLWGDETLDLNHDLRDRVIVLNNAVESFVWAKSDSAFKQDFDNEMRSILYAKGKDDEFNLTVKAAIEKYKVFTEPHLRNRQKIWKSTLTKLLIGQSSSVG